MANQTETVTGLVEHINAQQTGIKVDGRWLGISQFHPLAELPRRGQRVEVQAQRSERGMWIQAMHVLDGGQVHDLPAQQQRRTSWRTPSDPREIRRLACLKAAATFAAGKCLRGSNDVKTADVLKVAEAFERWVQDR